MRCDDRGWNAVHYAAAGGAEDIVRLLIRKESALGLIEKEERRLGLTPLHLAACRGHLGVVMRLIERGACVHRRGRDQRKESEETPLAEYAAKAWLQPDPGLEALLAAAEEGLPPRFLASLFDHKDCYHALEAWIASHKPTLTGFAAICYQFSPRKAIFLLRQGPAASKRLVDGITSALEELEQQRETDMYALDSDSELPEGIELPWCVDLAAPTAEEVARVVYGVMELLHSHHLMAAFRDDEAAFAGMVAQRKREVSLLRAARAGSVDRSAGEYLSEQRERTLGALRHSTLGAPPGTRSTT